MFAISLKLFLGIVLSMVPFMFGVYMKNKANRPTIWSKIYPDLIKLTPFLIRFGRWLEKRLLRFYDGMKRFDSFRKFYTLIVMMVMLLYQYVDFNAAFSIAEMIQAHPADSKETMLVIQQYGALMTNPFASFVASVPVMAFFSFKAANWILNELHSFIKVYYFAGLVVFAILLYSTRFFVVTEVIFILLIASYFYPEKVISATQIDEKNNL